MKRFLLILFTLFLLQSCIPLRVAPTIDNYKITKGKKFKRSLPKRQMFIFEDPKDAEHFYNYVNTKYDLRHANVYDDVPFQIKRDQYFFSFYEVEIKSKAINLFPFMFDVALHAALGNDEFEPVITDEDNTLLRQGNWYIAIEVYSDSEKDCLAENSLSREAVLKYLRALKKEYLSTHNYNEIVFKN